MVILLVEAGDASLRIAQVEQARKRVSILKDATFELPQQLRDGGYIENLAWFTRFLSSSLETEGFSSDAKMIFTLGDSLIRSKTFMHPPTKPAVLKSFAIIEAETVLRGNPEDYIIETLTYGNPPDVEGQIKSVLYAVERAMLLRVVDALSGVGFNIIKVLPRIASFVEAVMVMMDGNAELASKTVAAIDFTDGRSQLVIFENGQLLFESTYGSVALSTARLLAPDTGVASAVVPPAEPIETVRADGDLLSVNAVSESTATQEVPKIVLSDLPTITLSELVAPVSVPSVEPVPLTTGVPRFTPANDSAVDFLDETEVGSSAPRYTPGMPLSDRAMREIEHAIDPAVAEVMRGLRIVLAAERLDLDLVVVSGGLSVLPGMNERVAELAGAPCVSVDEFYRSMSATVRVSPQLQAESTVFAEMISLAGGAVGRYTGSLDLILERNAGRHSSTLQTAIIAGVSAVALLAMAVVPANYFIADSQVRDDERVLASPAYTKVDGIRNELSKYAELAKPVEDTSTPLPVGQSKVSVLHGDLYGMLPPSMQQFSFSYEPLSGELPLSFSIDSTEEFLAFKARMESSSYFDIKVPLTYSRSGEGTTTIISGAVTLRHKTYSPLTLKLSSTPVVESASTGEGAVDAR